MIHTFKATHCGTEYVGAQGAQDLRAHVLEAHGRKMLQPGSDNGGHVARQMGLRPSERLPNAPGWSNGKIQPPTAWAASKTPKGWEANLRRIVAQYGDDVTSEELVTPDGHYSNLVERMRARGLDPVSTTEPPYAAMPASLASIVKATVARAEYWHVVVKDGAATLVELASSDTDPRDYAKVTKYTWRKGLRYVVKADGAFYSVPQTLSGLRQAFGKGATRKSQAA